MKEFNDYYNVFLHNMLIDYLLLTHNLEEELKNYKDIVISEDFITSLKDILVRINQNEVGYPPIAQENGLKILKFISDLKDNDDTLQLEGECFEQVIKMDNFSYEKYNMEYEIKQNGITLLTDKPYTVWKLEDLEKSLEYDFLVTLMLNYDNNDFLSICMPKFLLDKKFVYSINKFIYLSPDILTDSEYQKRVRTIIKSNISLLNNIDEDIKKAYVSKNGCEIDKKEIENFKEMCENILISLEDLEKEPFSIDLLREYYDFLKVENYLYLDDNDNKRIALDRISLPALCNYIDLISNIEKSSKKRLIDAMDSKKQNLSKEERDIYYYHYLGKLNSLEEKNKNISVKDLRNKADILSYLKASIKFRLGNLEDYIKIGSITDDLENFEAILLNKDTKNDTFKYSLRRFMHECNPMFMSSKICDNAVALLDKNNDYSSKILKKEILKNKKDI